MNECKSQIPSPYVPTCFIATLTYGSTYYEKIGIFRLFRDKILLGKFGSVGKIVVKLYYNFGAHLIFVANSRYFKKFILTLLLKPMAYLLNHLFEDR